MMRCLAVLVLAGLRDAPGVWGERSKPYPDFAALAYPVYLPFLRARAALGCEEALQGISHIATPEAAQLMLGLLDNPNPKLVARVAESLLTRLPSPPGTLRSERELFYVEGQREYFVLRAWRPEFAAPVREHARRLLAKGTFAGVGRAAEMIRSVGTAEDGPAITRALDGSGALCCAVA